MPQLNLRAQVELYLQDQQDEPCDFAEENEALSYTPNQQRQVDLLCQKIEHDRGQLIRAMYLDTHQAQLEAITTIFNSHDTGSKKILLDEPLHMMLILAINTKKISPDIVDFLLDVYKKTDPLHTLLKSAFEQYPQMLALAIPIGCVKSIHSLITIYKEVGYLKETLILDNYSIFATAATAHPDVFKEIIVAYREVDPSMNELKKAVTTYHSKMNLQHNHDENKPILNALTQEFNNGFFKSSQIYSNLLKTIQNRF